MKLNGQRIVILGGSSGIGLATAQAVRWWTNQDQTGHWVLAIPLRLGKSK